MKTKGKVYPKNIYMVTDSEHVCHFYESDPMRTPDRDAVEVTLAALIVDSVGEGTVPNPVMIALNCAVLKRSEPFAISQPGSIRSGALKRDFEDMAGRVVDILETQNTDPEYPFNGVLLSRDGRMLGTATYSTTGECKDQVSDHTIVCVDGEFVPSADE